MSTVFFVDVETTGLYPVEKNLILELGITAVSEPDFTEIESFSTVIYHEPAEIASRCDNYAFNMHKESGLIEELRQMHALERPRVAPKAALLEALAFVNRHAANAPRNDKGYPELFLCGANPQFDRDYLKSWMPDLAKKFHHRVFDVNTLFLFRRFVLGGPVEKFGTAHRTIADNRQALAGVHTFIQSFGDAVREAIQAEFAPEAA